MRRLFEHKLIIFLIAAVIAAAVLLGVFAKSGRDTSLAESVGGNILSPINGAVSGGGNWFNNIFSYFGSVKTLREENEKLKNENTNLHKQILDMKGLDDENRELRKMLDLAKKQTKIDMLAASVTSKDPSNWYSTLTIDRGSNDGIKQNQPVVNSNRELIGQISRVGGNWAEIVTILDPQSSVGALIKRSKEIGIVEGSPSLRYSGKCSLGYIARDTDIKEGDFVETSGLGGIFPKGLIIGKVTEVYDENATMSKSATVEPLADISRVNEVFVITAYKEDAFEEEPADENEEDTSDNSDDIVNDNDDDEDESEDEE